MEPLSYGAGSPVVSGERVFVQGAVGVADGRFLCVSLATGDVLWQLEAGTSDAGWFTPSVVGNVVFGVYERGSSEVHARNGRPLAVAADTGALIWRNDDVSVETSPVLANGRLFFHGQRFAEGDIDDNVGLFSLDASTGDLLWLDNYTRYSRALTPTIVAENGVFRFGRGE